MTDLKHLSDLEQLVDEFKRSGLRELHARHGDFEIYLSQDADAPGLDSPRVAVSPAQASVQPGAPAPAHRPAAAQVQSALPPPAAGERSWPEGAVVVSAPYLGSFYRSPKPGSPPYVEIGDLVTPDSELCLVEVMKLFTGVRAGVRGRIAEVLAGDGDLVAADQPLFVIMPE